MNTVYEVLAWEPLFSGIRENFSWMESPRGSIYPQRGYSIKYDGTYQANSGYNGDGGARPALYH